MTRRDIAQRASDLIERTDLDGLVGCPGGAPNAANKRQLIDAINAALQEMRLDAPRDFWKRSFGYSLRAPVTTEQDAAYDSVVIDDLTGVWESWMAGCSVAVSGDPRMNRIVSATELLYPYLGPGAASARTFTIYHDSIELGSEALQILGGVWIDGKYRLRPVPNEVQRLSPGGAWTQETDFNDYAFNYDRELYHQGLAERPTYYYIDSEHRVDPATGFDTIGDKKYLRFRSYPSDAAGVNWTAIVMPGRWTTAAFDAGGEGLYNVGVPGDHIESIFLPYIYQNITKWFSFEVIPTETSSDSRNILQQIYQDFVEAKALLKSLAPQVDRRLSMQVNWSN